MKRLYERISSESTNDVYIEIRWFILERKANLYLVLKCLYVYGCILWVHSHTPINYMNISGALCLYIASLKQY